MALANSQKLHFVLIPLLAQGHMIPMIDMARLFAEHGVKVSLVTTPHNASRFAAIINRSRESEGKEIELIQIPFPSEEVGLPPGCENLDSVPSRDLIRNFYTALNTPYLNVKSDTQRFVVPGLPMKIEISKNQLPGAFMQLPDLDDIRDKMEEAESSAYGVVVNTFTQLENGCAEEYKKAINKKKHSNWPFIWVIKNGEKLDAELEKWLMVENFEERIKRRGLVIKGWAPQVLILSHPAIKGFLTHCGWNSTIESMSCGVPMITWPMFAEQFFNEKLIVEVLRIGVKIGVEIPVRWGEEKKVGVLVHKVQVANAVEKLMDGGEEGEMRRNKAKELGLVARRTMEENGTSRINILNLIQDILNQS
nr:UDP-glycosyltransferase [Nicotiana tabacum]